MDKFVSVPVIKVVSKNSFILKPKITVFLLKMQQLIEEIPNLKEKVNIMKKVNFYYYYVVPRVISMKNSQVCGMEDCIYSDRRNRQRGVDDPQTYGRQKRAEYEWDLW